MDSEAEIRRLKEQIEQLHLRDAQRQREIEREKEEKLRLREEQLREREERLREIEREKEEKLHLREELLREREEWLRQREKWLDKEKRHAEARLLEREERLLTEGEPQQETWDRQQESEQGRGISLPEYIISNTNLLYRKMEVETDKNFASQGGLTKPDKKWCPTRLRPWSDFPDLQKEDLRMVFSAFPEDCRVFGSVEDIRYIADNYFKHPKISSEAGHNQAMPLLIERPVEFIIGKLMERDPDNRLKLEHGVEFLPDLTPLGATIQKEQSAHQLRSDRFCILKYEPETTPKGRAIFVVEHKAPHKLTVPYLQSGLRRLCEMNIYEDVAKRTKGLKSNETDTLVKDYADKLTASVITQTFHCMIEFGLEYGYLTTGEAIVFLKIDWEDPTVLYYHLANPLAEIEAHKDNAVYCTVISQVLAFTLRAIRSPQHMADERQRARKLLKPWAANIDLILRTIPSSVRKSTPAEACDPEAYASVDRSPFSSRETTKKARKTCRPEEQRLKNEYPPSDESDDESPTGEPSEKPCPLPHGKGKSEKQQDSLAPPAGNEVNSQHCTQKCLLGLIDGGMLDRNCPNYPFHVQKGETKDGRHPIDHATWRWLVEEQLEETRGNCIKPMGLEGAKGALFKMTLMEYGYTFVGKGTIKENIRDLRHEVRVYRRLRPLQGRCVPVFLGLVNLGRPYDYFPGVEIVHMMFLSWSGERLPSNDKFPRLWEESVHSEVMQSVEKVEELGVIHNDWSVANLLWCEETGQVMVIDFDQAELVKPKRQPLKEISPNKLPRSKKHSAKHSAKSEKQVEKKDSPGKFEQSEKNPVDHQVTVVPKA
ncbi:hypothetical protein VTN49DRAFT_4440 [Thermomyces lanuginosus]|uniref:uncharacterized protein n=1 Tax=Thermomyces lanuginosus TaxID=5541 RepID=UPI0037441CB4